MYVKLALPILTQKEPSPLSTSCQTKGYDLLYCRKVDTTKSLLVKMSFEGCIDDI